MAYQEDGVVASAMCYGSNTWQLLTYGWKRNLHSSAVAKLACGDCKELLGDNLCGRCLKQKEEIEDGSEVWTPRGCSLGMLTNLPQLSQGLSHFWGNLAMGRTPSMHWMGPSLGWLISAINRGWEGQCEGE